MIKNFYDFINEKLTLNDISKMSKYRYQPKDKEELISLMKQLIKERGDEGDFSDIDTSLITDMSFLFYNNKIFNGDISRWNTSKVTDMSYMFSGATRFNCDISRWDTSRVTNMEGMFWVAKSFNQPLNKWNTSRVEYMGWMFDSAESFRQDISNWNVKHVELCQQTFRNCPIKEEYKPKFK